MESFSCDQKTMEKFEIEACQLRAKAIQATQFPAEWPVSVGGADFCSAWLVLPGFCHFHGQSIFGKDLYPLTSGHLGDIQCCFIMNMFDGVEEGWRVVREIARIRYCVVTKNMVAEQIGV